LGYCRNYEKGKEVMLFILTGIISTYLTLLCAAYGHKKLTVTFTLLGAMSIIALTFDVSGLHTFEKSIDKVPGLIWNSK
jgi:hypothetical protein